MIYLTVVVIFFECTVSVYSALNWEKRFYKKRNLSIIYLHLKDLSAKSDVQKRKGNTEKNDNSFPVFFSAPSM